MAKHGTKQAQQTVRPANNRAVLSFEQPMSGQEKPLKGGAKRVCVATKGADTVWPVRRAKPGVGCNVRLLAIPLR